VPLTHKFFKQSPAWIFCNEHSRFTPLDPKLHFDTARKSMQNWPHWCHYRTSSLNKVASEVLAMNAPDPLHWTPNSCVRAFRTISLLHEIRCKTSRTGAINANVRKIKSCRNFLQQTHPMHSIGPKTHVFGCFGPFCYCTKVDAKLADLVPLSRKFAIQSRVGIFSQRTHLIHSIWPKTQVFWAFRTVSFFHESRCKTGRTGAINAQVR
jgi:hypothetical protein